MPSITDDFVEPDAAVHVDEQGAFGKARRLRMGHQGGVQGLSPDGLDFGFVQPLLQTQVAQNAGKNRLDGFGR